MTRISRRFRALVLTGLALLLTACASAVPGSVGDSASAPVSDSATAPVSDSPSGPVSDSPSVPVSDSASSTGSEEPPPPPKPNIVFVLTDDLSWNLVSQMPHVQALQASGETFSKYYVTDSLCCPSRSSIFTGQFPHDDGVFTNLGGDNGGYAAYNSHGDEQKAFAPALQRNGYSTAFLGKYLNGYQPTNPIPPGWDTWDVTGDGYAEYNYDLNENGTVHHYGGTPSDYLTDVLSAKAGQFIDSATKPFMMEVATFAPHAPYTVAPRYARSYQKVPFPKTPAYNVTPTSAPSWLARARALSSNDSASNITTYRKRVGADLAVDDLVGHLENELQAKGVADNTYFVFSSDNGYHLGDYRLLAGKTTAFDTDINVPLIVAGPQVPAGRTNSNLVSSIDLAPTFESLTGTPIGSGVDGTSLAGLWHGEQPTSWQQAVLIEHHRDANQPGGGDPDAQTVAHARPPTYQAVRTANALYVRYLNGEQEYYDTTTDPYELHNIAAQGVPASLQEQLTALPTCHGTVDCQQAAGA